MSTISKLCVGLILVVGLCLEYTRLVFAAPTISFIGSCTGTSSCTTTNQVGDLEIAYAFRNASATAPTLATGWTSVTTNTLNGTSTADSAIRMACKVATGTNEASNTFTNANKLVIHVYRGQRAGTTATCASAILGTPANFKSTVNTTSVTETFSAITSSDPSSWIAGFGACSACTAGINTAPTGMTNHSSVTGPPAAGGHDSNGPDASFSAANVTLTTAGRIFTTTIEIKAAVATTPNFSLGTGTYNNDQSITITGDAGDTFCYTTDGSDPDSTTPGTCTTGSTYSSPVAITATGTTLKAIATKAGTSHSAIQSATYALTVGTISSSPGPGTYTSIPQSVTLTIDTTTGAVAHYTTDGSAVSCASTTYSGAFTISATTTVNAIGCKTNYNSANAISDLYTIALLPTVTTQAVTNIKDTTATANGTITDTGGGNADKQGFVYDTASHSLPGNVAPASSGYASGFAENAGSFSTGGFTVSLTNLNGGTPYYGRAYAHNTSGYSYGDEVSFTPAVISISITSNGVVSYGILAASASKSTTASDLNNTQTAQNGSTIAEDFNIKGQDTANWTLAGTPGANQYVHEFSTNAGGSWTALTATYQALASNVAASGTQNFDLRLTAPVSTGSYSQQTASVTIQAVAH